MTPCVRPFLVFFILFLLASPLSSQERPNADDLIAAYVEAIGGREAHLSPASIRTVGTLELSALGLEGEFEILQVPPNRMRMRTDIDGVGEVLVGFDGETGWNVNPLIGPSLMEGAELEQMRERANLNANLRETDLIPVRETIELTEYGGEPCWRVRLEWVSGRQSFDCYSPETGLLIASQDGQATQMGNVQVTTLYSDYREFSGMLLPTRMVQQSMGQEQVMTIQSVEIDQVDPDRVSPPQAVRTLLDDAGGR